jgi:hypothetical protein
VKVATQARLCQWAAVVDGIVVMLFLAYFPTVTLGDQQVPMIWLYGPAVLVSLSIPVVAAAVVAVLPWRKALLAWILAGLLAVFVAVTIFSVGMLYVPMAVLSAVAAHLYRRAPIEDAPLMRDEWRGIPSADEPAGPPGA